ncbi:putative G-protein coupled receptor 142 [Dissostichus eleginoides]|uniref:G-protein coupled receptor 142 n=1 Tax=Dissostichus eleginoides TaxID=100907 RepID=A0AAD9BD73_DISEL|nr:putative G-protein coupled receptor 142 [Dissostichus eleginoides]
MIDWPNVTASSQQELGLKPEELQKSKCVLGFIPVIYYSILLCVGVPVNILTAVALSRLASRTKKALYYYLLAVTASDILSQLFIIFVGFLLETAVFHRDVPILLLHSVSAAEFAANHASIWSTVPLTVDRIFLLLNSLIIHKLKVRQRQQPCQEEGGSKIASPRLLGKTTAMLLAITSVFSVLWAPRTVVVIYHLYVSSVHRDWRVHLAYDLSNMLAMLNTAVNFFLYCFVSNPFRGAVRDVLLLRGGPLYPRRALPHPLAPTNASISSLYSGNNKRSQRYFTPLSPHRARKPS